MTQPTCPRCQQAISLNDTIAFDGVHICHVDCRRPRDLTQEERALLFKYCFGHAVAECSTCTQRFRQQELASDLLSFRTHLCPRCRTDLTENTREHLYACAMLPEAVRQRAQDVREAGRKLIKESDHPASIAYVLIAEAEAAIVALRETMRLTA